MAEVISISQSELQQRRSNLRRRRRLQLIQKIWQIWALVALTGGIFWGVSHPIWLIRDANQIEVEGNQILSDQAIKTLIALDYPQSLIQIKPEALAQALQGQTPITSASVVRQLFPPRINIYVEERYPVAQAIPTASTARNTPSENQYVQPGLLDQEGIWMPRSSFTLLDNAPILPELKVFGMRPSYRKHWPNLYQTIRQSPVDIKKIDWDNPNNLILYTHLGPVHFGPYSYRFKKQLAVLDHLRTLPEQIDISHIAYIDLRDPDAPSVQFSSASQEGADGLDND